MSEHFDVAVIGGSLEGLVAAAFLAKAGQRVVVLEADATLGGVAQNVDTDAGFLYPRGAPVLQALDPLLLRSFAGLRRSLTFAARDLPLTALSRDGHHLTLERDLQAGARAIGALSQLDAAAWPEFRRSLFELGRTLRRVWWEDGRLDRARLSHRRRVLLAALEITSVAALLDSRFENDLLKGVLAFDTLEGLASPLEPGSALPLAWRAAQEMCGLQGAVAIPRRGTGSVARLVALEARDAGATLRTSARVARVRVEAGRAAGVILENGDTLACDAVLSTLSRRATLLDLVAPEIGLGEAAGLAQGTVAVGEAVVVLGLSELAAGLGITPTRFVIADRIDMLVAAHAAARAGNLPDELAIEAVLTSAADMTVAPPGKHVLCCTVRPVPLAPAEGWTSLMPKLSARVIAVLDRFTPGLLPKVVDIHMFAPVERRIAAATPEHMLLSWSQRLRTSLPGLLICGGDAGPVDVLSGRAGRLAAAMVMEGRA